MLAVLLREPAVSVYLGGGKHWWAVELGYWLRCRSFRPTLVDVALQLAASLDCLDWFVDKVSGSGLVVDVFAGRCSGGQGIC